MPATKRSRGDTVLDGNHIRGDALECTGDGFGGLKTILGTIPAIFANYEVRL